MPTDAVTPTRTPPTEIRVLGDRLADLAGDGGGRGCVGSRQQDGELVAADPGDQHVLGELGLEHPGNAPQDLVAGPVAVAVVHVLEVVEVEDEQGAAAADPLRVVDLLAQCGLEVAPIGEPGQAVVIGEVLEALDEAMALGDVAEAPDSPVGAVRRVGGRVPLE